MERLVFSPLKFLGYILLYKMHVSSLQSCIGFLWQGFGSGGALGVASVTSC